MAWMNQSEYARHRASRGLPGCTRQAVSQAVRAGRIHVDADGEIDPVRADVEWARNSAPPPTARGQRRRPAPADVERAVQRIADAVRDEMRRIAHGVGMDEEQEP